MTRKVKRRPLFIAQCVMLFVLLYGSTRRHNFIDGNSNLLVYLISEFAVP